MVLVFALAGGIIAGVDVVRSKGQSLVAIAAVLLALGLAVSVDFQF